MLRVMMYHRVEWPTENPYLYPKLNSCDPDEFDRQLDTYRRDFDVVSLADVLAHIRGNQKLPGRALLITFDDAYTCFKTNVWPRVKAKGLPISLFVPTEFPDNPNAVFWWDRLYGALKQTQQSILSVADSEFDLSSSDKRVEAYRTLRATVKRLPHSDGMSLVDDVCEELAVTEFDHHVLSWAELRQLAQEGVELAPHSRTHPMLNRITIDEAVAEAVGSRDDLARQLNSEPMPCFAYPSGGVTPEIASQLHTAGFEAAFSTERGINKPGKTNYMSIRRINVGTRTKGVVLRAQLNSFFPHSLLSS